ncbi:MAG TPA: transporter [Lachnospiraceae bacterium]|nr:transporter [Lachnospiraceae bacterium]
MSSVNEPAEAAAGAKKKSTFLSILLIQLAVIVYTGSGICSKMTSNFKAFSFMWIFWVGMEVVCLGIYAIFWQQIIKHFDLSIAYANRATAIFWSMLWAMLLFGDRITIANTLGILIIFTGVILVNQDAK